MSAVTPKPDVLLIAAKRRYVLPTTDVSSVHFARPSKRNKPAEGAYAMFYADFAARRLRAEAQCHKLSEASLEVSFLFRFSPSFYSADLKLQAPEYAEAHDNNKERTETAENMDEQALLALVATKQEQILR
jgi:hypothetical protein